MLEDDADVLKQLGVDAFLLENLIDVGAVTTQLTRKPSHGSVLPAEFLFYETAYMNHIGSKDKDIISKKAYNLQKTTYKL